MAVQAAFDILDLADLTEMKTGYIAAIKAVAVRGGTYSISGRSFTSANLQELSETLGAVNIAIAKKAGATSASRILRPNMNPDGYDPR